LRNLSQLLAGTDGKAGFFVAEFAGIIGAL
jgi:hypothetical protein